MIKVLFTRHFYSLRQPFVLIFINQSIIRVLKYIVTLFISVFLIVYAIPAFLVQLQPIQKRLAEEVKEVLSKELKTEVNIGEIEIKWLSRLVLKDLTILDQQEKTLLEVNTLSAGFKIWPLLKKRWVFTTIRLFGFSLNMQKETPESTLNLQFIIDTFSAKDSTRKKSNIDLRINAIMMRQGHIGYHIETEPSNEQQFTASHFDLNNVNGKLSIDFFNSDTFEMKINKLSLDETSGLHLKKLSMDISGNHQSLSIRNLSIILPNSHLKIEEASIDDIKKRTESPITLQLSPSTLSLKDLSPLVPILQHYKQPLLLSAKLSGTVEDLVLENLSLKQDETFSFSGNMRVRELTRSETPYLFGKVNSFQLDIEKIAPIIDEFNDQTNSVPPPLLRLGKMNFNGEISGFTDRLVAYGKAHFDIGTLEMDLLIGHEKQKKGSLHLKGKVASSELKINELFSEESPFGTVQFTADIDASRQTGGSFKGSVQAELSHLEYNRYQYNKIILSGHFQQDEFEGNIQIDDPNGKLYAQGLFKNKGEESAFHFNASLSDIRLDKLHLSEKYETPKLSCEVISDLTGNDIDNFEGEITIGQLSFTTVPDSFTLQKINLSALGESESKRITLTSDILDAEVSGIFSFSKLFCLLKKITNRYLPSLSTIIEEEESDDHHQLALSLTIGNTESLSRTLKLPFTNIKQGSVIFQHDETNNLTSLDLQMPRFKIGKSNVDSCFITCYNQNEKMLLNISASLLNKSGKHNSFLLKANAANDRIESILNLQNVDESGLNLNLASSTLFVLEKEENGSSSLRTEINIDPDTTLINNTLWQQPASTITITKGNIHIDHFMFSNGTQHLNINGTASKGNPKETIQIDLNDLELSYIFDIVNIPALQFGGNATGIIRLNDLYGSRIINTDLEIQHFSFNGAVQGRLNLFSEWDNDQQGILLLGTIYHDQNNWTDVNGYIYPAGSNEGLSLYFDAKEINLGLLQPYVQSFSKTMEGKGSGKIRLFGPFDELTFEGEAYVTEGRIGVDFLNTVYQFSDSIFLTPNSFYGNGIELVDRYGNRGTAHFSVNHQHLTDFHFQAEIVTSNLLLYDVPEKINPQIHGRLFGQGKVQLKGNERLITIDANIKNNAKSSLSFNFTNASTAENYDFVRFKKSHSTTDSTDQATAQQPHLSEEETEIRINALAEITDDANIEMILDPTGKDKIRGYGEGSFQIQYGTKKDFAMYGNYTINNGSYNFNLQQVMHHIFQIREGSRVLFQGDPMHANLNITASYPLLANVEDLDEMLVNKMSRSSVPVNCVLKLDGQLQKPAISFDLEFPNSTEELKRQVKAFIDTDEMMTRQVVYLLVLKKFYTPDYSKNAYRTGELSAVASSAISAQLSHLMSSLTDKVQIGTNIRSRQDGITDTEVEMLLSSQLLDNRLRINGNIGYKNNFIQSNAFVGEFDLEYKLTPRGEIRLKAYNHANDMYRYNMKSMTRQGVGVMFRKDFSSLKELFKNRDSQPKEKKITATIKEEKETL